MPVVNLVNNLQVDYIIAEGRPQVRLSSSGKIRHRGVYAGVGTMVFHWVSNGKTSSWRYDPVMPDASPMTPKDEIEGDGETLTLTLGDTLPATGLLRRSWEGEFIAPAIHVDVPMWTDIWVFLLRSPWFPLRMSTDRSSLTIEHGDSRAISSLAPGPEGSLEASVSNNGTSIKRTALSLSRRFGSMSSLESIGEVEIGTQSFEWRPITRQFDLCLVTGGSMSLGDLRSIAEGLGAVGSGGIFGTGGSVSGDFILCDGPLTNYSITLKGDAGLLSRPEDSTGAKLTW